MEKQKVRMINTNPKSRFFNKVRPFSEGFAKSSYAKSEGWVIQELPKAPAAVKESIHKIPEQPYTEFNSPYTGTPLGKYRVDEKGVHVAPIHTDLVETPSEYSETPETFETSSEDVGYATKEQVEKLSNLPESNPVKAYADKAIEIGIAGKPTPEPKRRGRKPNPDKAVTKSKKK